MTTLRLQDRQVAETRKEHAKRDRALWDARADLRRRDAAIAAEQAGKLAARAAETDARNAAALLAACTLRRRELVEVRSSRRTQRDTPTRFELAKQRRAVRAGVEGA